MLANLAILVNVMFMAKCHQIAKLAIFRQIAKLGQIS